MKHILITALILFVLVSLVLAAPAIMQKVNLYFNPPIQNQPQTEQPALSEPEAKTIAESSCIKGGEALGPGTYNENSKTWWFDANLNATKPGCNPACVVSEDKTVEINWRCTGAIPPADTTNASTTGSEECTKDLETCPDGSLVGRTEPNCEFAKCPSSNNQQASCSLESRQGDVCADVYDPVCATVQIQCIKAPCNPVQQTFSNACEACHNQLVSGYVKGECKN